MRHSALFVRKHHGTGIRKKELSKKKCRALDGKWCDAEPADIGVYEPVVRFTVVTRAAVGSAGQPLAGGVVMPKSSVIPGLRYQDAPAAIEWLCKAFGFAKHAVYSNPDGTVAHAQLTLGDGMVMLSSVVSDTPYSKLVRQPGEVGGWETQSPYLMVADCDAVYAEAKQLGAEIVLELEDKDYGGKGFTCRDLEGHLWSVGTYDPWQAGEES